MPWLMDQVARCRTCGREREEGERFSRRGKCAECGEGRLIANRRELRAHDGPFFQHWRRACVAAFGGVLVDELEAAEYDDGDG